MESRADMMATPEIALTGEGASAEDAYPEPPVRRFEALHFAVRNAKLVIGLAERVAELERRRVREPRTGDRGDQERQHDDEPDDELRVPRREVQDLGARAARPTVLARCALACHGDLGRCQEVRLLTGRRHQDPWIPARVRGSTMT